MLIRDWGQKDWVLQIFAPVGGSGDDIEIDVILDAFLFRLEIRVLDIFLGLLNFVADDLRFEIGRQFRPRQSAIAEQHQRDESRAKQDFFAMCERRFLESCSIDV